MLAPRVDYPVQLTISTADLLKKVETELGDLWTYAPFDVLAQGNGRLV